MLGKDEKRFLELRSKLFAELEELGKQIDALMWRRDELTAILDGSFETSPFNEVTEEEFPPQLSEKQSLDDLVVSYIAAEGPVKRGDITAWLEGQEYSSDSVHRALERCKRRGLIQVKGKSRAAVWTAVR